MVVTTSCLKELNSTDLIKVAERKEKSDKMEPSV